MTHHVHMTHPATLFSPEQAADEEGFLSDEGERYAGDQDRDTRLSREVQAMDNPFSGLSMSFPCRGQQ